MEYTEPVNYRSKSVCPQEEYNKMHFSTSKDNHISNNGFTKTFFLQEKNKGDEYFRNTKVGSCRKILVNHDLPLAMTFKIKNTKGEPLMNYDHTYKKLPQITSTYFHHYCTPKTVNHVGMDKKPLVPYDPFHTRNQLMEEYGLKMRRNFSLFNIGSDKLINRKQWVSTYKDSFKKFKIKRISNPGILSDLAKRRHYKFNNIEFA